LQAANEGEEFIAEQRALAIQDAPVSFLQAFGKVLRSQSASAVIPVAINVQISAPVAFEQVVALSTYVQTVPSLSLFALQSIKF
jgi:ABC-type proline/glycine betaine transport system permease subunit